MRTILTVFLFLTVISLLLFTSLTQKHAICSHGAQQLKLRYVNSYLWNNIEAMKLRGNHMFCIYVNGLSILDMSIPSKPSIVGKKSVNGRAKDVYLIDNYAYVATEKNGVVVLDISNLKAPSEKTVIHETANEIDGTGNFIFAACGKSGIEIIDIKLKINPKVVVRYASPGLRMNHIKIRKGFAYIGMVEEKYPWKNIFTIIDISNPFKPKEIAKFFPPEGWKENTVLGSGLSSIEDIAIKDNIAYIASGGEDIVMVDISEPLRPRLISYFRLPQPGAVFKLFVYGNLIHVNNGGGGYCIVDISKADKPRLIFQQKSCSMSSVTAKGNLVFVGPNSSEGGLLVYDVSDPAHPNKVGSYWAPTDIERVYVKNGLAYVMNSRGFTVLNVRDPGNAAIVGDYNGNNYLSDSFYDNKRMYLTEQDKGLKILDVSDAGNIRDIGFYRPVGSNTQIDGVLVQGKYCYLVKSGYRAADPYGTRFVERNMMEILDISNPSSPQMLAERIMPDSIRSMAISGEILLAHGLFGGIYAFKKSKNNMLSEVGKCDFSHYETCRFGNLERTTHYKNYALVAQGDCGLRILDVSEPSRIQLLNTVKTKGIFEDVFVLGNLAYIANVCEGIEIINMDNIRSPQVVGRYDTPGRASGVCADGNYVYIADEYSLIVLRKN